MLLRRILRDDPEVTAPANVEAWLRACFASDPLGAPIDDAVLFGFRADRLAYAFASGYHAALRSLVPSLPRDHVVALAATERGGAHPRAIETRLVDGTIEGRKQWTTLGDVASTFLVVASTGVDAEGKNRLSVVRVDRAKLGVHVTTMPETPFAPEIRHAELVLEKVAIDEADVLEGDGYDRYLKPFRTIEDLHVHGALLGYLVGLSRRRSLPRALTEELVALIVTTRELALDDPKAPEVHVALGGLLSSARRLVESHDELLASVDERWARDRPLLLVAERARIARLEAAWRSMG